MISQFLITPICLLILQFQYYISKGNYVELHKSEHHNTFECFV